MHINKRFPPQVFYEDVFYYRVRITNKSVIYSPEYPNIDSTKAVGYDVYLVRDNTKFIRKHEDADSYWGLLAWSYTTLEAALNKCKELEE